MATGTRRVEGTLLATTGVATLKSFTAPKFGGPYTIRGATSVIKGGAPTVELQILDIDGATILAVLASGTTSNSLANLYVLLKPGETVRWQCTAGIAATTADVTITVDDGAE